MSPSLQPSEKQREVAALWLAKRSGSPLSEDEKHEFEAWLNQDKLNRLAWDEMRVLWAHLEEPAKRVASLSPPRSAFTRNLTTARGWAAVACGGAFAACAVFVFDPNFVQDMQADIVSGRDYITPVSLPDGSVVRMGADTALSYQFDSKQRQVQLLRGEAFFEVVPGSSPDFKIDVNGDKIRVIGTRFNVDSYSENTTVSVSEGIVSVQGALDERPEHITRGQEIVVTEGQAGLIENNVSEDALSWMSGRLVVDQAPVSQVVAALSRHSTKKFYVRGHLASQSISGTFSLEDIDGSIDTLSAALDAKVVRSLPFITLIF